MASRTRANKGEKRCATTATSEHSHLITSILRVHERLRGNATENATGATFVHLRTMSFLCNNETYRKVAHHFSICLIDSFLKWRRLFFTGGRLFPKRRRLFEKRRRRFEKSR